MTATNEQIKATFTQSEIKKAIAELETVIRVNRNLALRSAGVERDFSFFMKKVEQAELSKAKLEEIQASY